jgi:hypothetical protein
MATSGEIAAILSRELGMKMGAVQFYAQAMRNAGLISKGGRGLAAHHLTTLDVSNWLLALCSAETASTAATEVELTRKSPLDTVTSLILPDVLRGLKVSEATTAGEAIEFLLGDMIDGRFAHWQQQGAPPPASSESWYLGILRPTAIVDFVVGSQEISINLAKPTPSGKVRRSTLRFAHADPMFKMKMRTVVDWSASNSSSSLTRINRVHSKIFERVAHTLRETDD